MADSDPKKAERLVSFRKLEREQASMEVTSARTAMNTAQSAVHAQEKVIDRESDNASAENGEPLRPEDMVLALACLEAERFDLIQKQTLLKNAKDKLGVKAEKLLVTHKKVRQMEILEAAAKSAQQSTAKSKERREIDDLAVNREARR
jgi:hypothetical protein